MRLRGQSGFTLLEVLVALVIATLALGALFSGAVTGLRSVNLSGHYMQAVSRATSHLATVGIGSPLVASKQEGDDGGGFRWQLSVRPLATASLPDQAGALGRHGKAPRVTLYAISVIIAWRMDGGLRQVELETQKIGPAPPGTP
jgi:general secretion pathway protein I